MDFAEQLQEVNFLDHVITSDETWCYQYDPKAKCQSMEWIFRMGSTLHCEVVSSMIPGYMDFTVVQIKYCKNGHKPMTCQLLSHNQYELLALSSVIL
jgi:hypothetical protein